MYLSAHDTTVAAFMSGIDCVPDETPPFASVLFIELYSNKSAGAPEGAHYVTFSYNGKKQDVGKINICDEQGRCEYNAFSSFLQSKEIDGDIVSACNPGGGGSKEKLQWWVFVLAAAGLIAVIVLIVVGVRVCRKAKDDAEKYKIQEDSQDTSTFERDN